AGTFRRRHRLCQTGCFRLSAGILCWCGVRFCMKALKIVAFVVGGIVVLLGILVVLAFTPSVQTWAVRKFANQPGTTIEVGRVAANLTGADITDLRYVKDGMVVTAKGVTARYTAWDYISKKRINASQVDMQD